MSETLHLLKPVQGQLITFKKISDFCQVRKNNSLQMLHFPKLKKKSSKLFYLGDISSEIMFDSETKVWKWIDSNIPDGYATIDKPFNSMLIGKMTVDFTNMKVG